MTGAVVNKPGVTSFDPTNLPTIKFSEGIYKVTITIKDKLGATTEYEIPDELIVR